MASGSHMMSYNANPHSYQTGHVSTSLPISNMFEFGFFFEIRRVRSSVLEENYLECPGCFENLVFVKESAHIWTNFPRVRSSIFQN